MNRYRKIFSTVAIFIVTKGLLAAPAAPHLMTFEQPDGSKFQGFLKGDEYFSWIQTENKEVIVKNNFSGFYEFGMLGKDVEGLTELRPSGVRVVERGIGLRRLPISLGPVRRSDLGKIWERMKQKRIEERRLLLPKK